MARRTALALVATAAAAAIILSGCSGAQRNEPAGLPSGPAVPEVGAASSWVASLSAPLPADLPASPSAACALITRPAGWLRIEDAQPGDAGFRIPPEADGAGVVRGYTDRSSAACGDEVTVHLSGPTSTVRLEAYRIGAYRTSRARLIWSSGDLHVGPTRRPRLQPHTHLVEPDWPVTVAARITTDWPAGFYLLIPRSAGGPAGPAIPLVIRDDAGHEPVLLAASTMTWNAYGDFGGYSLYRGPGVTAKARYLSRARVVTFRRPLTGTGYEQLVSMDLPVVEQIEQLGLDAAYTTDVDVDLHPSQLLRHAELVFGGHSEYWTRREYDAMEAARNRGVNLAFLGANNLWWHARLEDHAGGTQPDLEVVWREVAGDPTPASRPSDYTLLWSQWPEHRDAAAVLGQDHAGIDVHGGYQVLNAPAWMLNGTGVDSGSVLPMAVGNEADGYNPRAANPPDLDVVAAGVLRGSHGPVTVSASYYSAPSGAGVFAAGSTDWSCALGADCPDQAVPAQTARDLRILTRNVLTAFARPDAGRRHPSAASFPPPTKSLLAQLKPAATGSYGEAETAEEGAVRAARRPGVARSNGAIALR
jgi:hypothetical protein